MAAIAFAVDHEVHILMNRSKPRILQRTEALLKELHLKPSSNCFFILFFFLYFAIDFRLHLVSFAFC